MTEQRPAELKESAKPAAAKKLAELPKLTVEDRRKLAAEMVAAYRGEEPPKTVEQLMEEAFGKRPAKATQKFSWIAEDDQRLSTVGMGGAS